MEPGIAILLCVVALVLTFGSSNLPVTSKTPAGRSLAGVFLYIAPWILCGS